MNTRNEDRYELLRRLAIAGAASEELRPSVESALKLASELAGLDAAAIYLWNDKNDISLTVSYSVDEATANKQQALEEELLRSLRQERSLTTGYLSFGGDDPLQSFTMLLLQGGKTFGALTGISRGKKKLLNEDSFFEAITAALALNIAVTASSRETEATSDLIDRERLSAVVQTAVAVNHEINNPLTAILGNVQLLLLKRDDLDEELLHKLKTIEQSAMRIRDVTQKLLNVKSVQSIHYTEGTTMLDLSQGEDSKDDDSDKETKS